VPRIQISSQTSLHELNKFLNKAESKGHKQLRAVDTGKKDLDGTPIYILYSKSSNSICGKKLAENSKRQTKFKNADKAIRKVLANTFGADKLLGKIYQRRMPSKPELGVGVNHAKSVMQGVTDTQHASVHVDKRHQVQVGMGQGAVGPLSQVQFYSDSFQSCAPLVLYNKNTGQGGLFHIPAFSDEMPADMQKVIGDMIDRIEPTEIKILQGMTGKAGPLMGMGRDPRQEARVQQQETESALKKMCQQKGVNAEINSLRQEVGTVVVTRGQGGKLDIQADKKATSQKYQGATNVFKGHKAPDAVTAYSMKIDKAENGLMPGSRLLD